MKKLILSSVFLMAAATIAIAQCTPGALYQGGVAPGPGGSTTMTTCAYAGEYQAVTGVVSGDDYVLTYTGGVGNYITLWDATFTAVAFGASPLSWTATGSGTYYSQANLDGTACGTDFTCHTGAWANVSPPPPCPAEIAPWTETFTTTVNPPCWTQSATTGGPWVYTGNPGYDVANSLDHTSGVLNNYAWIDFSGTDAGVILTTPEIDVTALAVPELRFWMISHYLGALSPYNLNYVEAWDGAVWQPVGTIQGETGPGWVEHTFVLSPFIYNTNFVQIRFRAESGGASGDFNNDLLLDDVSVVEAPTCPQPIGLTLDASDLTSATVSWTPTGSETEWAVEYGAPGFTPGTGTTELATPTGPYTHTITGLASNNFFEAYVRAVCTPGDTSFYIGPVGFNTYNQPLYMEWNTDCGPGFVDISGTGTPTNLADDGELGLALPFQMLLQGMLVNDVTIAENGVVVLGTQTANVGWSNSAVASAPFDGICGFWDDLDTDFGDVYYETIGTPGNQQFIVQFDDKNYYFGPAGEVITFQIVIDEATSEIWALYDDTEFGGSDAFADNGASATVGLAGPNQDLEVSFNNATFLANNSCIHYYYTDCPSPTAFTATGITTSGATISWSAGMAGETNWTIIYGPQGFDPLVSGTTINTTAPSTTISGLNNITMYDVYIYADCNPGVLQSNPASGSFITLPNCSDVTSIGTITSIDSLFSSWGWMESSGVGTYPSTGFNLQYGVTGFSLYDGTQTIVNADNNYTDTTYDASFIAGGVYDVYVQAVCGTDTSNWIPATFIMPLTNDTTCLAEMLPVDGSVMILNNAGATIDPGETAIAPPGTGCSTTTGWCNSNVTFTTWFTFVAPASGNIRLSGLDVGFDGQFAVYEVTDCADFNTYTLIGANDDDVNGGSGAPNFTLCGLTAGNTYWLMHDSYSTFATGNYSIRLSEIDLNAGTSSGIVNVCIGDTANLYDGLVGYDMGGTWTEELPTANFSDPYFPSDGLATQIYNFEYRVIDGCAYDSIIQQVELYGPSSAGIDGSIDVCMNQPINLLSGLSGNVDLGGTWYDPSNNPTSASIVASSIPGQFNYDYITSNGVCPEDSSNVVVNVLATCDYLNIESLMFGNITIHPNPTSGVVYITNIGSVAVFDYELTDINGRVIQTEKAAINGAETTKVNLEDFDSGVYLIRIFNNTAGKTFRVVKE